jgi:hypothetical protein
MHVLLDEQNGQPGFLQLLERRQELIDRDRASPSDSSSMMRISGSDISPPRSPRCEIPKFANNTRSSEPTSR